MSSNKTIREMMIRKYGRICMMEAAGIRKIPVEERKKLKGYKRSDETLTYHHLTPQSKGGKTTEANGSILKWYNHAWLERLPQSIREEVNRRLRAYREEVDRQLQLGVPKKRIVFAGMQITGDGRIGNQIMMDLDDMGEFIEIPVYPNQEPREIREPQGINPDDVIRARMEEVWEK